MIYELVQDFSAAISAMPKGHPKQRTLVLLDEAIRYCANTISKGERFLQAAYNWADDGFVHDEAAKLLQTADEPWLRLINRSQRAARPACLQVLLTPHLSAGGGGTNGVAVVPHSGRMLSWGADATFQEWDHGNGQMLRQLERTQSSSNYGLLGRIARLSDGTCVLVDKYDDSAKGPKPLTQAGVGFRVWDTETWQCLSISKPHEVTSGHVDSKFTATVAAEAGVLLCVGADQGAHEELEWSLKVWSLSENRCVKRIDLSDVPPRDAPVRSSGQRPAPHRSLTSDTVVANRASVAVSPDGEWGALYWSTQLQVWNLRTGELVRAFVDIRPTGECLIAGGGCMSIALVAFKTILVLDIKTGGRKYVLSGHTDRIETLATTADGRHLLSGSFDRTVRLWDLATGECVRVLRGHTGWVSGVAFIEDGRRAVSCSWDHTIRIWDLDSDEKEPDGPREVWNDLLTVSADGRRAVTVRASGLGGASIVDVWDVARGAHIHSLVGHSSLLSDVTIDPSGKYALTCDWPSTLDRRGRYGRGELRVWDLDAGTCRRVLRADARKGLLRVAVTPDGARAIVGGSDGRVRIWDTQNGRCIHNLSGHRSVVEVVAVTPEGRRAISAASDKTIRVWDIETGECLQVLSGDGDSSSFMLTPMTDGRHIVSFGSQSPSLRLWDIISGECVRATGDRSVGAKSVAVTPDGQTVVVGQSYSKPWASAYDLQTMEALWEGEDRGAVTDLCITPDGQWVISAGRDNSIRVRGTRNGSQACLLWFKAVPTCLAASASGRWLVIGTGHGGVQFVEVMNLSVTPPLVTPTRMWLFGSKSFWPLRSRHHGRWDDHLTTVCPLCACRIPVADVIPHETFPCPSCGGQLLLSGLRCDMRDTL